MSGIEQYRKADVDVVVLTYNHESHIEQNIVSILSQKTNFRFNLIIADDCSTDGTKALIQKWAEKDDRVFLIANPQNVGAVENAMKAIEICQSDYLAFCEGDDFWLDEEKLQTQVDFLKNNPRFGMVHGDVSYFYQSKNSLGGSVNQSKGVSFPSGKIFNEYLTNDRLFIFTASVLIKRELFILCANYDLFKSKKWMAQDLPTWLELANQTEIAYLERIFAAYRLADESASRSKNPDYLHRFHQSVFDIRYYFWNKYSGSESVKIKLDEMYALSLLSDLRFLKKRQLWSEIWSVKRNGTFRWGLKRWLQFLYLSVIVLICGK
jgi:glycosyltransferase involved in cell wall biosynthesis